MFKIFGTGNNSSICTYLIFRFRIFIIILMIFINYVSLTAWVVKQKKFEIEI